MKNQNGITLIALVITIIVLLILAGVAIAMLSGENGILTNASKSAKDSAISNAKEQIGLVVNEAITEYYGQVYVNGVKEVETLGVQAAVINAVAGISETYDDITFNKPTAVTSDTKPAGDVTFTIVYTGDATTEYGTINSEGKLSWSTTAPNA